MKISLFHPIYKTAQITVPVPRIHIVWLAWTAVTAFSSHFPAYLMFCCTSRTRLQTCIYHPWPHTIFPTENQKCKCKAISKSLGTAVLHSPRTTHRANYMNTWGYILPTRSKWYLMSVWTGLIEKDLNRVFHLLHSEGWHGALGPKIAAQSFAAESRRRWEP